MTRRRCTSGTWPELPLTSLWCIPAGRSKSVLVIARYHDGQRGMTHLLRWTPGGMLEPGAWTSLDLRRSYCLLDPTGEFLLYEATRAGAREDPGPKHFRGAFCGGRAVSRAPWLSALTHIQGKGITGGGEGRSIHALSDREQARLWAMFEGREYPRFSQQQPGWVPLDEVPRWPSLARSTGEPLPAKRPRGQLFFRPAHANFGHGTIVLRTPTERSRAFSFKGRSSQFRFGWRDSTETIYDLPDLAWAWLRSDGTLLSATHVGVLRWHAPREGAKVGDFDACWKLRQSRDCSVRTPEPAPSPAWARAPLG